jgi:predicted negative regulator of RcsB-dependent stress response
MAEDYLSDREQEEALRNWWRENWRWIIGGIVLGLALLGGWRYWESYRVQRAEAAAKADDEFHGAIARDDLEQASRLLKDLVGDHRSSAYAQQARLLLAKSYIEDGKFDEAVPLLRAVADESKDKELGEIARLRAARVLIQQGKQDEALQLLEVEKAGSFAAQVREVRGDALLAKGDSNGARAEYAAALAANTDAQIDRTLLEMKLQEVGGDTPATEANATEPPAGSTQGQQ